MEGDGPGDDCYWFYMVLSSGVAVGAAALSGSGCGVVGGGQRAPRVVESRAAWRVRLKLLRPGSRPWGVALVMRSRMAW